MGFTGVTKNLLIGVITRFITGRETSCSFSVFCSKCLPLAKFMKKCVFLPISLGMLCRCHLQSIRIWEDYLQDQTRNHTKNTSRDPIHIRSSPTYGSFIPNNHSGTNHCHCWTREKGHMKPWDHAFLRTVQANSPWNLPPGPLPRLRKKTSVHGLCLRMPL